MKTPSVLPILLVLLYCICARGFLPPHQNHISAAFGRLPPDGSPLLIRGGGLSSAEEKTRGLFMNAIDSRGGAKPKLTSNKRRGVDWSALLKYTVSMVTQVSLIFGVFSALDKLVARFSLQVPFVANVLFFYFFNTKTGTFSPLNQCRDTGDKGSGQFGSKKNRPSWTPPGYVFAVMWPIFVFGLRATTAAMIVDFSAGRYATATLMTLFGHLAFGNLWNTV